jgi:hypothetical protein
MSRMAPTQEMYPRFRLLGRKAEAIEPCKKSAIADNGHVSGGARPSHKSKRSSNAVCTPHPALVHPVRQTAGAFPMLDKVPAIAWVKCRTSPRAVGVALVLESPWRPARISAHAEINGWRFPILITGRASCRLPGRAGGTDRRKTMTAAAATRSPLTAAASARRSNRLNLIWSAVPLRAAVLTRSRMRGLGPIADQITAKITRRNLWSTSMSAADRFSPPKVEALRSVKFTRL